MRGPSTAPGPRRLQPRSHAAGRHPLLPPGPPGGRFNPLRQCPAFRLLCKRLTRPKKRPKLTSSGTAKQLLATGRRTCRRCWHRTRESKVCMRRGKPGQDLRTMQAREAATSSMRQQLSDINSQSGKAGQNNKCRTASSCTSFAVPHLLFIPARTARGSKPCSRHAWTR